MNNRTQELLKRAQQAKARSEETLKRTAPKATLGGIKQAAAKKFGKPKQQKQNQPKKTQPKKQPKPKAVSSDALDQWEQAMRKANIPAHRWRKLQDKISRLSGADRKEIEKELFNHEMFKDEDLVIAEYSATVVGLEILRAIGEELEEEMRKKAVVQMAIGTLSYSELEAVEHIFEELNGKEGLLVASKIADRVGITRSVIVNALRKFESAGVIESRSLGMKGTHIKVLNDKLLEELKKVKN